MLSNARDRVLETSCLSGRGNRFGHSVALVCPDFFLDSHANSESNLHCSRQLDVSIQLLSAINRDSLGGGYLFRIRAFALWRRNSTLQPKFPSIKQILVRYLGCRNVRDNIGTVGSSIRRRILPSVAVRRFSSSVRESGQEPRAEAKGQVRKIAIRATIRTTVKVPYFASLRKPSYVCS